MEWFRFYTKALESRKVQTLPPALFKAWVNLLCVARIYDGEIPPEEAAYRLRTSLERVKEWLFTLRAHKLIEGPPWRPHDWDDHQCNSDSAVERMRAYRKREREKNVLRNALRNSDGVDQIRTDTDTEQTVTRNEIGNAGERMYALHPKKRNMVLVLPSLEKAVLSGAQVSDIEDCHAEWCKTEDWRKENGKFAPPLDRWIADKGYTQHPNGNRPKFPTAKELIEQGLI
jgi:hypothetical protein